MQHLKSKTKPREINREGREAQTIVAQLVNNPPAMWETGVQSLGWEDPLEKGMAMHSIILAWRIPWTEESDGLQSIWSQSRTQLSD